MACPLENLANVVMVCSGLLWLAFLSGFLMTLGSTLEFWVSIALSAFLGKGLLPQFLAFSLDLSLSYFMPPVLLSSPCLSS